MRGETYGAELATNYKVSSYLMFKGSYSLLRMALHGYPGGAGSLSETAEGKSPRNQIYAGAFLTLPKSFELSTHAYFVGKLSTFHLPSYTRLDVNIAWKALETVELSVAAQNLLGSHTEFGPEEGALNPVKPTIYGKVGWRF